MIRRRREAVEATGSPPVEYIERETLVELLQLQLLILGCNVMERTASDPIPSHGSLNSQYVGVIRKGLCMIYS